MIIINGKFFSGKLTDEKYKKIMIEIMQLPEPKVLPMDAVKIEERNIAIIEQRETAIIDQFATLESPEYMGSKHFNECILVYLHTETDHAIVHVDKFVKPDFFSVIKQFNNQENIYISLVGGMTGKSEDVLKIIIESLFFAAEKNIRIIIDTQKIMENNQEINNYQQTYDFIKMKTDVLYRHLYNETIDKDFLAGKKIRDFYIDKKADDFKLRKMISALCAVDLNPCKIKITCPFICSLDKKYFLELADAVFSQQGFYYCDISFSKFDLYDKITLKNFAIHLKTGNIHIIPEDLYTPNQYGRLLVITDRNVAPHYFCAYSNKNDEYPKPIYSPMFSDHLNKLKSMMLLPDFKDYLLGVLRSIDTGTCAHYLSQYLLKEANHTNGSNKSFHPYKKYLLANSHENLDKPTKNIIQHLNVLNKIFCGKFEAKQRKNPEYTMDAFLLCNSKKHSDQIHAKINAQGIHSILIEDDNKFYVCVPAINVKKYSDRIVDVYNKYFTNMKNNMRLFFQAYRDELPTESMNKIIRYGMRD